MSALPVLRNGPADPTPATYTVLPDKGPVVMDLSCVERYGHPQCMGAAGGGADRCTCSTLTPLDHAFCERLAHELLRARDYQPCEDCACRRGSPEWELGDLRDILDQDTPFHCHRGMPMQARGGKTTDYVPRRVNGRPEAYPVCMGWLRAYLARSEGSV